MSIEIQNELANFREFIGGLLQRDRADLSPEEALEMWCEDNPGEEHSPDDREAILEALAQLKAGEQGMTIEEFDLEVSPTQ